MKFRDLDRMSFFRFNSQPDSGWFKSGVGACLAIMIGPRTVFGPWVEIVPDAECEPLNSCEGDGKTISKAIESVNRHGTWGTWNEG